MDKRMVTLAVGGVLGALTLFGGTVSAADYPPQATTPTTVLVSSSGSGLVNPAADPASALAETGSQSDVLLKIAAGSVVAGAGLVAVAARRRRPAQA